MAIVTEGRISNPNRLRLTQPRRTFGGVSMFDREQRSVPFSASLAHLAGNALIALVGELDMATVPDLSSALKALVEDGPPELVLDLSGLSFIDSSGLAVFMKTQQRLRKQGRTLSITSPRPNALRVFETSGLMDVLNVAVDRVPSGDEGIRPASRRPHPVAAASTCDRPPRTRHLPGLLMQRTCFLEPFGTTLDASVRSGLCNSCGGIGDCTRLH